MTEENINASLEEIKKAIFVLDQKVGEQNLKIEELQNKIVVLESYDQAVPSAEALRFVPPAPPALRPVENIANKLGKTIGVDKYTEKDASLAEPKKAVQAP